MCISHPKSKAILACRVEGAESVKRRFVRKTQQGRVLRFVYAQEIIDIPLVEKFVYLGAVASYGTFEDQRSRRSLGKSNCLSLRQSRVRAATTHRLTANTKVPRNLPRNP